MKRILIIALAALTVCAAAYYALALLLVQGVD